MSYNWNEISKTLPERKDFNPNPGDLDEQSAWKQFGGKSLDEAYEHFLTNPFGYQEDFMFMGPAAFLYYFPVIELFLASIPRDIDSPDLTAHILAKAIQFQLENSDALRASELLMSRIRSLPNKVIPQIPKLAEKPDDQACVARAWHDLQKYIAGL